MYMGHLAERPSVLYNNHINISNILTYAAGVLLPVIPNQYIFHLENRRFT